jgi:type VI secretion system protein VasD
MKPALFHKQWLLVALMLWVFAPVGVHAKETKLVSQVVATANINPNRHGMPQPVKLHIYYLAKSDAFMMANLGDLIAPKAPILGPDLVHQTEVLIGPGEMLALDEKFDAAAQFIGVVAEFADIDKASWRAVAAVPVKKWTDVVKLFSHKKLLISVDGTSVKCAIED